MPVLYILYDKQASRITLCTAINAKKTPDGGKFADHYLTIGISNQKPFIMPRVSCGKWQMGIILWLHRYMYMASEKTKIVIESMIKLNIVINGHQINFWC